MKFDSAALRGVNDNGLGKSSQLSVVQLYGRS